MTKKNLKQSAAYIWTGLLLILVIFGFLSIIEIKKVKAFSPDGATWILVPMQGDLLDYSSNNRILNNTGVATSSGYASFSGSDILQVSSTFLNVSFESDNTILFSAYGGTTSTDATHIVAGMRQDGQQISAFRIDWDKTTQELAVWCNGFGGSPELTTTGDAFPAGAWANWAVVMDEDEVIIYKNNSNIASASTTDCNIPAGLGDVNAQEYALGDDGSSGGGYGYWGDLRYYLHQEEAWTQAEITGYFANPEYEPGLTVSMAYPIDNIQSPEFTTWVIDVTGLGSSTGQFGVEYGQTSSSLNYSDTYCSVENGEENLCFTGSYARVGKSRSLVDLNYATTTWFARPYFLDSGTNEFEYGVMIEFQVSSIFGLPNVTSSIIALANTLYINTSSTDPLNIFEWSCPEAEDWTDIAGGILEGGCKLFQFIVMPSPGALSSFSTQYYLFKQVFPFNIVFSLSEIALQNSTSSIFGSESTDIVLASSSVLLNPVTILNSSTMANVLGSDVKNLMFSTASYIIWLMAGVTVWKMII